jgi:DNA-binding transcriptional LysR family regulator
LTLTAAGRALVARADAIATELAAAEARLAVFARTAAGQVRLAALPSSNATLVPDALADLAARGLEITVSLVEAGPDQAFILLQRAECDLAVTFDHPTLPTPAWLVAVPLLDDHLFVILPAGHSLAGAQEVDLARLATVSVNAAAPRRCTPVPSPGSSRPSPWPPTTTSTPFHVWSPPGSASA